LVVKRKKKNYTCKHIYTHVFCFDGNNASASKKTRKKHLKLIINVYKKFKVKKKLTLFNKNEKKTFTIG
jgi:hypothetical protein